MVYVRSSFFNAIKFIVHQAGVLTVRRTGAIIIIVTEAVAAKPICCNLIPSCLAYYALCMPVYVITYLFVSI